MADETPKPKILLVEDDAFMVELLVHALGTAGFNLSVAKTGAEGLQKFKEENPALILLDLLLPDDNGLEVLRKIRREPQGSQVKVLVLSNVGETDSVEEAKRLGAVDYLVKANASLPEIIEKVRGLL